MPDLESSLQKHELHDKLETQEQAKQLLFLQCEFQNSEQQKHLKTQLNNSLQKTVDESQAVFCCLDHRDNNRIVAFRILYSKGDVMQTKNVVQSIINFDSYQKADVVLIGVPFDGTSSFGKGADGGPKAIKECLDRQIELVHPLYGAVPASDLKVHCQIFGQLISRGNVYPSEDEMMHLVEAAFGDLDGQFPIMIGGEHSITFPALRALAKRHRPKEVVVIQFDAHFDLRDTDADYSENPHGRFAHSCVMRRVCELGYDIASIGIRDFSDEEASYATEVEGETGAIAVLPAPVSQDDFTTLMKKIRGRKVYITIDVDGFDPSVMPATGTPVSGGLGWSMTRDFISKIFTDCKVIGADIVEVIASSDWKRDHAERLTVRNAAQLVYDMITLHQMNKHRKAVR